MAPKILYFKPVMNHDALIKLKIILMNERERTKDALDIYWARQNKLSSSLNIFIVTV